MWKAFVLFVLVLFAVGVVESQTCTCSPPPFVPTFSDPALPSTVTLHGKIILNWSGYPVVGLTLQGWTVTGLSLGEVNTSYTGAFTFPIPYNTSFYFVVYSREEPRSGSTASTYLYWTQTATALSGGSPDFYNTYILYPTNATLWTVALATANQALPSLPFILGNRTRLYQTSEIFRQLVGTTSVASVFGSQFNLLARHALANILEQAFADPTGALRNTTFPLPALFSLQGTGDLYFTYIATGRYGSSPAITEAALQLKSLVDTFESPLKADWILDISLANNPSAMFSKARAQYGGQVSDTLNPSFAVPNEGKNYPFPSGPAANNPYPTYVPADLNLIRYRDYLRNIFTGPDDLVGFVSKHADLTRRFKQLFNVSTTYQVPANTLVVPILTSILTAPTGTQYGFGLSVAAQGAQTPRAYLNYLIGLTGLSATQLSVRYRIDLTRSDDELSSAVSENIATLQGFYRDGYQAKPDPYPIISTAQQGYAPFFLYYSEWLQDSSFFPENHYDISQTFYTGIRKDSRASCLNRTDESYWILSMFPLEDGISNAFAKLQEGEYQLALNDLYAALALARDRITYYVNHVGPGTTPSWLTQDATNIAYVKSYYPSTTINTPADLAGWISLFRTPEYSYEWENDISPYSEFEVEWLLVGARYRTYARLVHAVAYLLPVLIGDVLSATGQYADAQSYYAIASRILVGRLNEEDLTVVGGTSGNLPYTLNIRNDVKNGEIWVPNPETYPDAFYWMDSSSKLLATGMIHPFEKRFLRLKHGNALLEWADQLYRTDDDASIQRARELYKAVLFIHGAPPSISPSWNTPSGPYDSSFAYKYFPATGNPAIASQITRANLGYNKIQLGLNYYGVPDSYVPSARYTVLEKSAMQSATQAKSAQTDFLTYLNNIEDDIRQNIQNTNAIRQAQLQVQVALQQQDSANIDIQAAQSQVQQVQAQITAKQQEIADHDSFWGQLGDFFSGFVSALSSIAGPVTKSIGTASLGAVGLGDLAGSGAAATGATTAAAGGAAASGLGLAAAAAPLGAYALFVYASVSSLNSMAAAQDNRYTQLEQLQDVSLPLAQGIVQQKQDELNIAFLQQQIAEADANLASELIAFDAIKTLNIDFWARVNSVLRRILRRYLELGAAQAWFAQRALSFEIGEDIDIIRMDYFPTDLDGVTGADLLLSDISELDEVRLASIHTTVPIKHTYSLAFDMPIVFGQLKQTGEVNFWTLSSALQQAYPGTYGHRIVSVDVVVKSMNGIYPARGILTNGGISFSTVEDPSQPQQSISRFPDAMPISEFQMREDMGVHGLPGDALVNFEGSGPETSWNLVFPLEANPPDFLDKLADVQITFDYSAQYSNALLATQLGSPTTVNRCPIFLLGGTNPTALSALINSTSSSSPISLTWDLTAISAKSKSLFPKKESNLQVNNVMVSFITWGGETLPNVTATLTAGSYSASFSLSQNYAISNNPRVVTDTPSVPSALNVFATRPVVQPWTLTINPSANSGIDFSQVIDIVMGIDYSATRAASPLF